MFFLKKNYVIEGNIKKYFSITKKHLKQLITSIFLLQSINVKLYLNIFKIIFNILQIEIIVINISIYKKKL